jgi:hypothetical protein
MSDAWGMPVTVWTARVAVGLFLVRWLLRARRTDGAVPTGGEAAVWSAGALVFLAHVAAAFHFVHGWSHAEALRHTADETGNVTGLHWGGGLYVNYLFTTCWLADAALVCRAWRRRQPLSSGFTRSVGVFLWFIVVNATLVFGPRGWLAVALVWAAAMAVFGRKRRRGSDRQPLA